jgi:steroid delta-isomerase-like uncharacterized protein
MADNEKLIRDLFEAFNNRDYDGIVGYMAPDATMTDMGSGRTLQGAEGGSAFSKALFDAMPDGSFTIDRLYSSGDTVLIEYTGRGTHTGDLAIPAGTLPATGRSVTMHLCDIYEIRDDTVQSVRSYFDTGSIMAQLGLMERLGVSQ